MIHLEKNGRLRKQAEGNGKFPAWIKFHGGAPDSEITGTNTLNCTDDSLYYGKLDLTYNFKCMSDTGPATHCEVPEFRTKNPEVLK